MQNRPLHPVSTKAVLFTPNTSHVLGMKYSFEDERLSKRGLPGGHLEKGEHPDTTVLREIEEELGIIVTNLVRFSFTLHEDGKVVLFYRGVLEKDRTLIPSNPDREVGEWITLDSIRTGQYDFGSYTDSILQAAKFKL